MTRLLRSTRPDAPAGGGAPPPPGAPPRTLAVKPRRLEAGQHGVVRLRLAGGRAAPLEAFAASRRLGRFVLRYGAATIAAGIVLKVAP